MFQIGFVCPVYNAQKFHDYTEAALLSFFATTPNGVAIVVDDGSNSWSVDYAARLNALAKYFPNVKLHLIHHSKQKGLTHSWNSGLNFAYNLGVDYIIAGNNDILFTPLWYEGMLHALDNSYALAGPLSNAPGSTAKGLQDINRYFKTYKLSDDEVSLAKLASHLHRNRLGQVVESRINGFFQLAHRDSWNLGRYDKQTFYRPINTHTSLGKVNKTPLMTLNEDELQARWAKLRLKSAIVLSSFIFHYRSVSRGRAYAKGNWYRIS